MKCPKCDWENKEDAAKCALCGADMCGEAATAPAPSQQAQQMNPPESSPFPGMPTGQYIPTGGSDYTHNTSGTGSTAFVPPEVRGWNWGAFFLNWIWSIAHNTWIGLLALVPYVGWIMSIVLGIKGSEWAWQNRRWESVDQFKATQRVWAYWGLAIAIVGFCIGLFAALISPILWRLSTLNH